jgi:hypothetical protein
MDTWQDANQQYLTAALERVRQALQRYAGRDVLVEPETVGAARTSSDTARTSSVNPLSGGTARTASGTRPEGEAPSLPTGQSLGAKQQAQALGSEHEPEGLPPQVQNTWGKNAFALERLCAVFGLSSFERDVLLLCAGVELEASMAALVAEIQAGRAVPTFGLALAALPEAHWSALTPAAPLRRWHLLELGPGEHLTCGETLTTSPLRLDERILHFLTGVFYLDERLAGLVMPVFKGGALPPSHQEVAEKIVLHWSQAGQIPPVILLGGERQASKIEIASAACRKLDMGLYRLEAAEIPDQTVSRELLARLWEREAALCNYALLLDGEDLEGTQAIRAVAAFMETLHSPLLIASNSALPGLHSPRPIVHLDIRRATLAEQRQIWQAALGSAAWDWNGSLDLLVSQFDLSAEAISAAVSEGIGKRMDSLPEHNLAQALWDACRRQAWPRLEGLAQRIESTAAWDDLVLPEIQRQTLFEIAAQVRQRVRVYETWGWAAKNTRGLGLSALFAGPSGTGKTLAAEVLANELRLDLFRIDLSSVVNKYIGETEKNLRRLFDAAEGSGAILLFDEADALFGKRSEVKDSHDRYANVEISYLLQRMETYRGLAILTSNLKNALDPAFLRRIRFIVNFPFPDAAHRAEIWKRMFLPQMPTEGLDRARLAKLNVAGGNIRNIALNAAFLAADAGEPVRMSHLLRAARSEYTKLEKTPSEAEVGGWVW